MAVYKCKPVDYSKAAVYKCKLADYSKAAVYKCKLVDYSKAAVYKCKPPVYSGLHTGKLHDHDGGLGPRPKAHFEVACQSAVYSKAVV